MWERWLTRKLARERAYLDRRARRGIHTPTDEVLEDDQRQQEALLQAIRQALACAPPAGASSPAGERQQPPLHPSCSYPEEA